MGFGLWVVAAGLLGAAALSVKEVAASRSLEAALYPPLSVLLALTFTVNLGYSLIKMQIQEPELRKPLTAAAGGSGRHTRRTLAIVAAVLVAGTAVRLINLANSPEWQLDEITYSAIARNLVLHHSLFLPLTISQPWQPFVYHPPFYLWLLADWYRIAGIGVTQSRILDTIAEMIALGLLSRMLTRLYGPGAAVFATILIVFDGWMLYVGRISYIENTCLVIMMTGLNLYVRALRTKTMGSYLAAGAVIGFAGVYNNDATYLIAVLVVHWLMTSRRDTRQHAAAVAAAVGMFVLYAIMMSKLFTVDGTNWWLHDTLVQLNRVTGGQKSAGTLNSPMQFVTLITQQYALFIPSVAAAAIATVVLLRRLLLCVWRRTWAPLGEERLVPAWAITAVMIFGAAGLHFSQYFVMFLLPLYSYLWVNMWPWLAARRDQLRGALIPALTAGLVLTGCVCAVARLNHNSSAFRQWQQYAAAKIPKNALLVAGTTGDPLAYVINQPFCSPGASMSPVCFYQAQYLITWQTTLQSANPLHLKKLAILLHDSHEIAAFHQFSGTITVYKITKHPEGG
jgi:4-amino-4-deoxy-L-arabinose transferase-like glycosyltransferase